MRRFTERGRTGAYLAVVEAGVVRAGDAVEVLGRPSHGITVPEVFRAFTGDDEGAARVLAEGILGADDQAVARAPSRPPPTQDRPIGHWGAGPVMLRRRHPDLVVLVDDAHLLEGTSVLQPLLEIDELADRDGGLLAVTTSSHALVTRFRGLDIEIARHRTALLLSPRPTDGDAFGVRRLDGAPAIPGRGVFIHHGTTTEVQVFLCEEGSVGVSAPGRGRSSAGTARAARPVTSATAMTTPPRRAR